ncbi:hypothetical protein AK812_SmicGene48604, partial [Symbiodinium microadriaticum]
KLRRPVDANTTGTGPAQGAARAFGRGDRRSASVAAGPGLLRAL